MFDWFHNRVPYTDFQQKNLDWLTETVREGEAAVEAKIEEADTAIENAEAATEAANTAKEGADSAASDASAAATAANNAKDAANTAAANAQAAADKWATPYASTTVAGMTDHAKIYVYTGTEVGYTAGNWYYWNGSAWTSGGVYVGDISDAVLFSTAQSKTSVEKAQAQQNADSIGLAQKATASWDSNGNKWINYIITKGHKYRFKNTGTANITTLSTVATNGSYTAVETISGSGIKYGGFIPEWVAGTNAPYLYMYGVSGASFEVEDLTSGNVYNSSIENHESEISLNRSYVSDFGISVLNNGYKIPIIASWEIGGLDNSTGADWNDSYVSIKSAYIHFTESCEIVASVLDTHAVGICIYNESKVFQYTYSVSTNTRITVPAGYYIRIWVYGTLADPVDLDSPEDYYEIFAINENVDASLPPYYDSYLPSKISEIITASAYVSGVTFPFITDVHFHANAKNSGKLIRKIDELTNAVPFVVFGGDVPKAIDTSTNVMVYADEWNKYMDYWGKHKTIQVHGNHDYMCRIVDTENLWFAPLSSVFEYVQQNDCFMMDHPPMALYGALDIKNQKIKIIFADNYDAGYDFSDDEWDGAALMSNEQLKWMAQTVLDSHGYSILFVSHVPTLSSMSVAAEAAALEPFDDLIKAARNKTTYTVDGQTFDFTSWDGTVIAELAGHMHKDASGTSDNVLYIGTTCDCYADSDPDVTRTQGTTSEQAFDVVCIDTYNTTIKLVRVGGGSSRGWNYSTNTPIT